MLYRLQKKDVKKAGVVLADAFRQDPLWTAVFKGESMYERKLRAAFEIPVRYGLRYGEVYGTTDNLEGIAVWIPGPFADMTMWRIVRSGAITSAMRMGSSAGKKMQPAFRPILEDRNTIMKGLSYIYLLVIGVATRYQGQGLGRRLLEALIEKSIKDGAYLYLETETEDNVRMYKKFGFEVLKRVVLPLINVPMWEMRRKPG